MVRNVASMSSLRNSMANLEVNNAASPNSHTTAPTTDGNNAANQQKLHEQFIIGDLIQRFKMGTATPEEWAYVQDQLVALSRAPIVQQQAAQATSRSQEGNAAAMRQHQAQESSRGFSSNARTVQPSAVAEHRPMRTVEPWEPQASDSFGQPQSHYAQQALDQRPVHETGAAGQYYPTNPYSGLTPAHNRALEDYQMQIKLIEQQNQRRLQMAAPERPATATQSKETPEQIEARRFPKATRFNAEKYCKPFCEALTNNPTVFHFVAATKDALEDAGFQELSERDSWENLEPGKSYFVDRNGSSLVAFTVGAKYKPGNGAAILAGHVDALTAKLKPISQVPNKAGYLQLGVAPYAGAPNTTWWDRDLSVGGRVLVKEGDKIVTKLVKLDWPIARIPTLAPHFGAAAQGPFNPETQMVPIIGLDSTESRASPYSEAEPFSQPPLIGSERGPVSSFVSTQPPRLVKAIGDALGLKADTYSTIVNWELELFDTQPATVGGLDKEFIFAGRIDDKLCSWAAVQALIEADKSGDTDDSSIIKIVGLFDDEEIGSLLRQGARGNFLPSTIERIVCSLNGGSASGDLLGRTNANSFIVSSDVIHAVNPNFLNAYLENHSPHLNVGVVVSADSNGHMTTDSVSTAILQRCADKVGAKLQVFQIRNDSRSGGTVGPMLSAATGIRAIDAGIPQLSMHSIRATTGSLDPGLGVLCFLGFLNGFENVDKEFR